jgi:hypothetical protein
MYSAVQLLKLTVRLSHVAHLLPLKFLTTEVVMLAAPESVLNLSWLTYLIWITLETQGHSQQERYVFVAQLFLKDTLRISNWRMRLSIKMAGYAQVTLAHLRNRKSSRSLIVQRISSSYRKVNILYQRSWSVRMSSVSWFRLYLSMVIHFETIL